MIINYPQGAKQETSLKLYYKKFPFKVEVQTAAVYTSGSYYDWKKRQSTELGKLTAALTKKKLPSTIHMASSWVKQMYYCETEADVNYVTSSLVGFNEKKHNLTIFTMTEEQKEMLAHDEKIMMRKNYYFDKYQWRLSFSHNDDTTIFDALQSQFFTDEEIEAFNTRMDKESDRWGWYRNTEDKRFHAHLTSARAKISFGSSWSNTKVYLTDDDDVALARLMVSSKMEIIKIVKA